MPSARLMKQRYMQRATAATALLGLLAGACAPATPSTTVRPRPVPDSAGAAGAPAAAPPAAPAAPTLTATRWEFRYAPGRYRYLVRTAATVTTPADSASGGTPLGQSALYTVRLVPTGTGLTATITADSLAAEAGGAGADAAGADTAGASLEALMSLTGQLAILPEAAGDSCDATGGLLAARARTLIVPLPTVITLGERWRDSTRTSICAGGVPLAVSAVQDYRVAGVERFQGAPALRLERSDTLAYGGGGVQAGRPVTVTGAGIGRAVYFLDPRRGILLGGTSESRTRFTVTTFAGGSTVFEQQATQEVLLQR